MMKKRMISFMLLTLTVLAAKAQENVFRLSGSLESTGDTITVYCVDLAQRRIVETKPDRKSTRLNSSHNVASRMPSSA